MLRATRSLTPPFLLAAIVVAASPAGAVEPSSAPYPVGPPARLLEYHAAVQARLTAASAGLRRLEAVEGGRWLVRWDERLARPRTLLAPGPAWPGTDAVSRALAFVARHEELLGVAADDLVPAGDATAGGVRYLTLAQRHRGLPVEGAAVDLRLRVVGDGSARLVLVRNRTVPVGDLDVAPSIGPDAAVAAAVADLAPRRLEVVDGGTLVVWPDASSPHPRPALAWRVRVILPDGPHDLVTYVDARTGVLLDRYDDVRRTLQGVVRVDYEERTVDDPILTAAVPHADVRGSGGTVHTDASGAYSLPGADAEELVTAMEGTTIRLEDRDLGPSDVPELAFWADPAATSDVTWTEADASDAARDVLAHVAVVRDHVLALEPDLPWFEEVIGVTVNIGSSACNAYYTHGSIAFYAEDQAGYCVNFGRVSDIVYHEVGHGVHESIIETGSFDGTLSEGSADYLAATIWDDPYLAPGAYGPGTWIRELDTDKVYPDDLVGEVHADGLIWGTAMWDLREAMIALDGVDAGVRAADLLFLGALRGGPSLTDAYDELLVADDDDGDLTNGTPHLCLLTEVMGAHGLGPGDLGYFLYGHEPLDDQPGEATEYVLEATIEVVDPTCSDLDPESLTVHHAVSPEGPFEETVLSWDGATGYHGAIPRYPSGAVVYYYLSVADLDGDTLFTSHGDDVERLYRFFVGDLDEIACDDMEGDDGLFVHGGGTPDDPTGGPDEWERGAPAGLSSDPDGAWSGDQVWGTDLGNGTDGAYSPDASMYLRWGDVDASGHDRVRLQYRRWLTVEDATYDHARLFVNDELVFENPDEGSSNHLVDLEWVLHDVDVDDLLAADGAVAVTWTLDSDQGLEYGGWNIDDVCLVALHDLAGLYTAQDFDASDGDEDTSTLTWTTPWATPVWAEAVVRRTDRYPQDVDDGVIVALSTDPAWGQVNEVVDRGLSPDATYYYAVFTADDEWSWRSAVVEGSNADTALTASAGDDDDTGDDDTGDDDTAWGDPPDDPPDVIQSSCACRADGGPRPASALAAGALAAIPAWLARRRRRRVRAGEGWPR